MYKMLLEVIVLIVAYLELGSCEVYRLGALTSAGNQLVNCIVHDTKITCDCNNSPQVRINSLAFCQFVNWKYCKLQGMTLPRLSGSVYQVEVINCQSLLVNANTLEETIGLRRINFKNVQNLTLSQQALAFSRYASNIPLIIEFESVSRDFCKKFIDFQPDIFFFFLND